MTNNDLANTEYASIQTESTLSEVPGVLEPPSAVIGQTFSCVHKTKTSNRRGAGPLQDLQQPVSKTKTGYLYKITVTVSCKVSTNRVFIHTRWTLQRHIYEVYSND